jgi:histidinol-phosphate aminotransferase
MRAGALSNEVHEPRRVDAMVQRPVVDLSSNTSVLGPSAKALDAAAQTLQDANLYPERQSKALLAALAQRHGVGTDQIMIGNGAQHVLRVIAATLLEPGDVAVGLDPTYPGYRNATDNQRGVYRKVPAVEGGYNADAWIQAVRDARLAWVCTPNNPTGRALQHDDAVRIVAALPPRGLAVIDSTYRDFVEDPTLADGLALLKEGAPVIVVHTFSKLYGLAGLRVGYAVAHPPLIAAMLERLDAFPVNRAGQAAALAALGDEAHQAESRRCVVEGRRRLEDGLRRLGVEFFPSQANFVTARFGDACPRVLEAAAEAGYLLRPMDGIWGLPGWLRITVGFEAHVREVLAVIEASLKVVGTQR